MPLSMVSKYYKVMTQNVPENKLNLLSYLQSNPLQINKKMQLFRAKQNFKNSLKNASILYLFFEILLGSEQLQNKMYPIDWTV